jgi:hypothetical protein
LGALARVLHIVSLGQLWHLPLQLRRPPASSRIRNGGIHTNQQYRLHSKVHTTSGGYVEASNSVSQLHAWDVSCCYASDGGAQGLPNHLAVARNAAPCVALRSGLQTKHASRVASAQARPQHSLSGPGSASVMSCNPCTNSTSCVFSQVA